MNVGSTSVDYPPALQAGFYCGVYGEWSGIASLVRSMRDVLEPLREFRGIMTGVPQYDGKSAVLSDGGAK